MCESECNEAVKEVVVDQKRDNAKLEDPAIIIIVRRGSSFIKGVFLIAENDAEQALLEKVLKRVVDPGCFGWLKRLFGQR